MVQTHRYRARTARAVLALVALTLLLLVAPSSSAPALADGGGTNGCTMVRDSGSYYRFHSSCDSHDRCYMNRWYGRSDAGRKACDVMFKNKMDASCREIAAYKRWKCHLRASSYYVGVRKFGGVAFWKWYKYQRANARMA